MTELPSIEPENAALRRENDELRRRAADAEQALGALARGEVDAVSLGDAATPLLLRTAQDELRRSVQLYRAIFDGSLDAVLLADDSGRYVDANPAACQLFGLVRADLVGRSISEFATRGHDIEGGDRSFRETGRARGTLPLQRADGTHRIVDSSTVSDVEPGLHMSVLRDITEQVASQEALRHSEARYRALIEKSNEAISLTRADGKTTYLTPRATARLLGLTLDELATRTPRDQVIAEDRERVSNELDRLARSESRDSTLEFRIQRPDGSARWIEASATNLLDDPDVAAIVANYRDITARKSAEEAQQQSHVLLEEAQAVAHVGSWSSGIGAADDLAWSRECFRIFGLPEGSGVSLEVFFACVHPADREAVRSASAAASAGDAPYDIEHRIVLPDGGVRWVRERAALHRDKEGRPARLIGTVQDTTVGHVAVEALRASEEGYRRIVENTSEGVWTYDTHGTTTFMNGRMAEMLGYTVNETLGKPIFTFVKDDGHADVEARLERRRRGIAERVESRLMRKDGTEFWASIQANPLFDSQGQLETVLVLAIDVTPQHLVAQARARLAAIVESSDDAILSESLDGTITSWNRGAENLYQYRADEMVGRSMEMLILPESQAENRRLLRLVAEGEVIRHHETTRRRKDGSVVEVTLTVSPIRDAAGTIIGAARIARDLTARRATEETLRRTEEQFRQAQKMEAVGRLAGGIAHDFNNLLSVILSYAALSLESLMPGDPLCEDIREIQTAGERATDLTRQLLAFSRQQVLQPRVIDLNQAVAEMERMLTRLLGEDVELTFKKGRELGRVLVDPGQIQQVVMNLAVNARDAMPDGGKLTIETDNMDLDAAHVGGRVGVAPGRYVMLAVSDTGIGMDAVTRARVFEPFFTTKDQGKGTGLGLSTVFGIAQQSGGYVGVYSEPGAGTTFKIYLPRTDRAIDVSHLSPASSELRGSETILLVEDEEQVRTVACMILRGHGYRVLEAANGSDGLMVSKGFEGKIHLLLTDVIMPRVSGRALAEQLTVARPEMRVLFVSGYTDDAIVRHGVLEAGVEFLQKPFTPNALLRRVRAALDAIRLTR